MPGPVTHMAPTHTNSVKKVSKLDVNERLSQQRQDRRNFLWTDL
jgi:hypothetical protein